MALPALAFALFLSSSAPLRTGHRPPSLTGKPRPYSGPEALLSLVLPTHLQALSRRLLCSSTLWPSHRPFLHVELFPQSPSLLPVSSTLLSVRPALSSFKP